MLKRISHLIFIPLFCTLLFACGGGGGSTPAADDGGGSSSADTTAPTVSSTSPENAATAVARNSRLTATFDEDIFAVTVDAGSFTLAKSGAGNTPGSISFDGVSNVATFAPDNPFTILTTYTATLSSAITDLSGNALASDYNWSFTTEDGSWGEATLIETDNAGNAGNPQIAVNSNGNALAVWQQSDGTRDNIWANRFDGTSWGSAVLIEIDDAGDAYNPQIAVDNNGNALAVWQQFDGGIFNIYANRFDGTSWGSTALIETDNAGGAYNPQITIDKEGNAFAVWQQFDGGIFNIYANRFDGKSWGNAELIDNDNAGNAFDPQIAFDDNGNALAVWKQRDGIRESIWANRFDGTSWGSAVLIEIDDAGDAGNPQIAVDNNGNALAVWQQFDGNRNNIWANRFDGTSWGSAVLIETDDAGDAGNPQIVVDNSGNALAVWQLSDGNRYFFNTWANRFDGTSWGDAELIVTDDAVNTFTPQIAIDNNGNALAVWIQYGGIGVNRFDGTTKSWGGATLIETDRGANSSQITVDNNGNALMVWGQSDAIAINLNIWANRFE